jgi:hypothetical protein
MAGCGRHRAVPRAAERYAQPAINREQVDPRPLLRAFSCTIGKSVRQRKEARRAPVHLDTELCVPETVADILAAHRAGRMTPEEMVARSYARIRAHADPAIFIALREEVQARTEARALADGGRHELPLYGIPVAVKDNIDVAGMATTAACPAFSYRASADAGSVARLRQAGAIIIGKSNLDQFATGLVGVRSPYGTPRNLFDPKLIPGGSSSGSAVAVAAGLVPLALGTDTAGSGACLRVSTTSWGSSRALVSSRQRGWCRPAVRWIACRCLRSRSMTRLWRCGRWLVLIPPIRSRRRGRSQASERCHRGCGSACRLPDSASSSAIALPPRPMRRRSRAWSGSAPPWSRSTSSRSTRQRGFFTRGPGGGALYHGALAHRVGA